MKENKLMATRKGEYVMLEGKFPRLKSPQGAAKLQEAIDWLRKL
jgi:hypothetical protein